MSEASPRPPMALWLPLCGLLLAAPGCIKDTRIPQDRDASGLFDSAPEVAAPLKDRCVSLGKAGVRAQCEESKSLGQVYVRRLSTGDEVCLEGGFGEVPGAACQTRATVQDVAPEKVLLQVQEARPESRWFNRNGYQIWFAEGALVDLYLAEKGY